MYDIKIVQWEKRDLQGVPGLLGWSGSPIHVAILPTYQNSSYLIELTLNLQDLPRPAKGLIFKLFYVSILRHTPGHQISTARKKKQKTKQNKKLCVLRGHKSVEFHNVAIMQNNIGE